MPNSRNQALERRRRLRAEYRRLYNETEALLFRHDPILINFGSNKDEYDPEAGTILPRLRTCASPQDATRVVHEEFVRWFGHDLAGGREKYSEIGEEIWELWRRLRDAEHGSAADGDHPMPPWIPGDS